MADRPVHASRRRRLAAIARPFLLSGVVLLLVGISFAGSTVPHVGRAVAFSAGAERPGAGSGTNVTVNLTDRPSFDPSSITAPSGGVLHLRLVNTGHVDHSFTVSNVSDHVLPTTLTPAQLNAFFAANGSLANVTVPAGGATFANVTLPASAPAGSSFEVVSVLPYQFQAGMRGFLNVSGATLGPGTVLSVQATDAFRFVPATLSVSATSYPATVDVHATNVGVIPHTWTVASQSNVTLTSGNYTSYFQSHPPMGRVVLQNGGETNWTNFTVLRPGIYEFICEVQGHFGNGMFGFLYVGVAPPQNATPLSTEVVQVGILAGAASLLGIGVLFALAAAFSGRFPRSPPGGYRAH